jgi:TolB-like protein/DNA-binding winged helix-turn-helix (wHTH) protein/Flp pilus assembly protein TadD
MNQPSNPEIRGVYLFEPFRLDVAERRLYREEEVVPLARQVFELLRLLVANAGRLQSREALFEALWPGRVVEEQALTTTIYALRRALGDEGATPHYIETVRGAGYRFIAPVETEVAAPRRARRWALGGGIAAALAAVLIGGIVLASRHSDVHQPAAHTLKPSIAVLPFENLSADKTNAYFVAGIQDEILTRLASIRSLKVISRTSTASYPSHPPSLSTIARQLGVSFVLEGSVQKADDTVHVNVQLIDAGTQAHVWAHSYNRKLTSVFGVEGEVAQEIAAALDAKLLPAESRQLARPPTRNAVAYDWFLRGEFYAHRASSSLLIADFDAAIDAYSKAVTDDPHFALAYARLSLVESSKLHTMSYRDAPDEHLAEQAKNNADQALQLDPTLAQAHIARGYYLDYALHDTAGQLKAFKTALKLAPRSPEPLFAIGVIYENLGRFDVAAESFRHSLDADPRNIDILIELAIVDIDVRRYAEAETVLDRAESIDPSSLNVRLGLVRTDLLRLGNTAKAMAVLDSAPDKLRTYPVARDQQAQLEYLRGNYAGARRIFSRLASENSSDWEIAMEQGDLEWAAGNRKQARIYYGRCARLLEANIKAGSGAYSHEYLGWIYARLGREHDALEQVQTALKLSPLKQHPLPYMDALAMMAQIQVQFGHLDKAIDILRRLFTMPSGYDVSVPLLKLDPNWRPLVQDPRFASFQQQLPASPTHQALSSQE